MKILGPVRLYPFVVLTCIFVTFWTSLLIFPEHNTISSTMTTQPERNAFVYDSVAQRRIFQHADRNKLGKRLQFETIRTVRELKLNRRKRGKRGGLSKELPAVKSRPANLIQIRMGSTPIKHDDINQINFATVNCRSLKPRQELIHEFMETNNIHCAVVTETWLRDGDDDLWIKMSDLNTNGRNLSTQNRAHGRGGGLALATTKQVSKVKKGIIKSFKTFEAAHWQITIKSKTFNVLGVYRTPNQRVSTVLTFTDEFCEFLMEYLTTHTSIIIMGDFNIHVNNLDDPDVLLFCDTMTALGLKQHVVSPTHKHGNILDLIYTDENEPALHCTVYPLISDHNPVTLSLKTEKARDESKQKAVRDLSSIDDDMLCSVFDENRIQRDGTLTTLVRSFEAELTRVLNEVAPLKNVKIRQNRQTPWFSKEVLNKKRTVRKLEDKYRKYKLESLYEAYLKERRNYVNMIRARKREHFSNQVLKCKGDSRALHWLVTTLTGTNKENPMPENETDEELANSFAEFFIQKIKTIRDNLQHHKLYEPLELTSPPFQFRELTEKEVIRQISDMKTKHCELDPIPTTLFKKMLRKTIPLVTEIVNLSLTKGEFCDHWKEALVKSLLKKIGLELIKANYRPVSNLPFLSKVVEKCMLYQLSHHYDTNNLLPDYQSAYRSGFSCETSLIRLTDNILWNFESKKVSAVAICDLSAAFDTVDHSVMKTVLSSKFGVQDQALKWFDSFLCPRMMKVQVGSSVSDVRTFGFSVPQGSTSGANLFNLYSSTLEEVIPADLCLNGFADDHSITDCFDPKIANNEHDTIERLEETLVKIKDWMNTVRLKMNDSKTEFMYFASPQMLKHTTMNSISVNGTDVTRSECVRLLGAWLDSSLSFKQHVTTKAKAASINLHKLRKI